MAALLEGANKEYHTFIIVSKSTLAELGAKCMDQAAGIDRCEGKTVGVEV